MTAAVSGVAAQPSPMKGGVYIHPCTLRRRSTAADVFVSLARNGSLADFLHHTRDIPTSVMEELLRIAPGQPSSSSLSSSRCPSDGTATRTMRELEEMAHSAFYTALRSATRVPQLVSFDFCITNATVPDDVMDGSAEAHPNTNQPRRGDDARVKEADPPFLPCERVVSGGGEPDDFPIRQRSSGPAATAPSSSSSSPSTTVSDVPQMLATNVRHRLFAAYLEHHLYAARITAPLALHKATFVETAQPSVWESVHGAFLGLREGSSLNASPCISGLERALLVMAVGEAATFHLHHTEAFQMTQDFASNMGDKVGRLSEVAMTAMQHPRLRHRSVVVLRLRLLHRHAAVVPLPASPSFLLGPISATSASSSATTSSSTPKHPGEDGEAANAPTPSESASFAAPVELTEAEQRLLARAIFGEETKEPFTQQEPSATTEEPPQPPQPKNTRAMSYHLRHMISAAFMQSSTTPITSTGIVLFSAAFFMAGQYLLPPGAATTTPPTTHNNTTDEVVEPEPTLESVLAKTMLRHPHDPATVDCLFRTRDRLILHTREKAGIFGVSMRGLRLGSIAIPCTMDAMLRATSPIVGQLRSYRANCPSRGRDGEIIAMCLALHQGRQQALVQQSLGFDRWIALLHNRAADGDELYEAAMVAPAERASLNNYGNSGAAAPDQSAAHNIFAEERAHTRLSNLTMFDAVRRMNECFSLSVKFPTPSASSSHPHPATTTTTTTEGAPSAGVAPTCPMSASHFYAIHPAESLLHVHHLLDEMGAMMQLYDCQRPRTNATSVADAIRRGAALSLPYRMQLDSLDARFAAGKVHLPHILYGLPGRSSSNDGPTPSPSGSGPTRGGALDLGQAAAAALFVPPAPNTPAARERVLMHRLLLQVVQKAYLGISYMMLGDVTEVENHIRAIFLEKMTTQPNTPPPTTATACGRLEALGELLHLLALALAELPGMAVMAYEACTASLTLHLEHSPLWMLRAHILARQKRFTQALADVEVAEYLLTVSTTGTTVPGSLHMDPTSPDDATAMMPGVPQKPNSLSALRLQTTRALKAAIQELVECTPGIVDV